MTNDNQLISETLVIKREIYFATSDGVMLSSDHIKSINAIQEFYDLHDANNINLRELTDALNEKFHHKGGLIFLYALFPDGPINQGCQLANLTPPDRRFY